MVEASREIPYVQRIIPNLLDDIRRARNNGSPDEYRRAVDTLELYLPVDRPVNIKRLLRGFKEGDGFQVGDDDRVMDGGGYFDKSYREHCRLLDAEFERGGGIMTMADKKTRMTDYRFEYIMYLLEDAGLLVHESGGAFNIDDI